MQNFWREPLNILKSTALPILQSWKDPGLAAAHRRPSGQLLIQGLMGGNLHAKLFGDQVLGELSLYGEHILARYGSTEGLAFDHYVTEFDFS